jgi:hypothetical protein
MKIKLASPLICPSCNEAQEAIAEDYLIPSTLANAKWAKDSCEHCNNNFKVKLSSDLEVEVVATD